MKMHRIIAVALLLTIGLLASAVSSFAAERMKYEDYQLELQAAQAREAAARAALETENAAIADLKAQLEDLDRQIAAVWDEIYAYLGVTPEQVAEFDRRVDDIERRLDALARISPEQLLARVAEIDSIEAELTELGKNPISKLTKQHDRIAALNRRLETLRASLPKPSHDLYTVIRGDYLWRIAGKQDIYADPWKWLRIWSYNRSEIRDPDLIYPQQQFTIPRELSRDEYLVKRGDSLKRIAGRPEVYGDPFQWTKLYQANKSGQFLSEPNKLYPEQILTVPRN